MTLHMKHNKTFRKTNIFPKYMTIFPFDLRLIHNGYAMYVTACL